MKGWRVFLLVGLLVVVGIVPLYGHFVISNVEMNYRGRSYSFQPTGPLDGEFMLELGCRLDTGAVDIVFCIDSTGSMGGVIADVRDNIGAFADSMEVMGYDYELGGVTFGDGCNIWDFDPTTPGVYDLTDDLALFESYLAGVGASGGVDGPETSMDAIYQAITMVNWRPFAVHVVIMFTDVRFCTTDYPSGGFCCCDDETAVSISDVFDVVRTTGTVIYNIFPSYLSGIERTTYEGLADSSGGATYDLGPSVFGDIFADVVTHLGEYAAINVVVDNSSGEYIDTLYATLLPRSCITPESPTALRSIGVDPDETVPFGWRVDIDSTCVGGERCFNVAIEGGGYTDTIFGCTTTEDCHCVGPEGFVMMPTPDSVIVACESQSILINVHGAMEDEGVNLDETTIDFRVNGERYDESDAEIGFADTLVAFNPTTPWDNGEIVEFSLEGIADLNGCPMDNPIQGYFLVDLQPPVVNAVTPDPDTMVFYTGDFQVTMDVADSIAGIDWSLSYITVNDSTFPIDDSLVSYTGDAHSGTITLDGYITDFGLDPLDTARVCFHGADEILPVWCGPNDSVYCFDYPIMILSQLVGFGNNQGAPCDTVLIPMLIDSIEVAQIRSMHFELRFDRDVVVPIGVVMDSSMTASGWSISTLTGDSSSATLVVDMSGPEIEAGQVGVLLYIRAYVPCSAVPGNFCNLMIDSISFNSGFPRSSTYPGVFVDTWKVNTWLNNIIINRTVEPCENLSLAIGASPSTSDSYEPGADLIILPPVPTQVRAYLTIHDPSYPYITQLRRDMRALTPTVRWVIKTEGEANGVAHWNPAPFPEGLFIMNDVLDMKMDTICYFGLDDSLVIEWRQPPFDFSDMNLCSGWNMISIPTVPPEVPASEMFPFSPVGLYYYSEHGYRLADYIEAGQGYWLFSFSDTVITVPGVGLENYNKTLSAGWNMIGSIMEPVGISDVCTSPSGMLMTPIYRYDCSSRTYVPSDTIYPGIGYWAMALSDGAVLSVPSGGAYCKAVAEPITPDWVGSIEVGEQTLSFGYAANAIDGVDRADIVLPPLAPDAAIADPVFLRNDIRFSQDITSSSEWVLLVPDNETVSFTLPEGMVLSMETPSGDNISIEDKSTINAEGGLYRISLHESAPTTFELLGVFPNPFNPSCSVELLLPIKMKVSVSVFDISGRLVDVVYDGKLPAGRQQVTWDGSDATSGTYFIRVVYPDGEKIVSAVLLK